MASLSHRQGCSFAFFLLIFPFLLSTSNAADTPSVTYRTSSSEVRVTFFATDGNNHPVETLDTNDFAVIDGEMVIRDFRSLARSNETALDIVLLLDTSQSVAPQFRESVRDVLQLISNNSQVEIDNVSVVTFAGLKAQVLCSSDCGSATLERKLAALTPSGPTPLFDSLSFTAKLLTDRHAAGVRQVVILFSDGDDTISGTSPKQALEVMAATGAIVYPVDLHSSARDSKGRYWLGQMAESTGGRRFDLREGTDTIIAGVLQDLRASYVVTYTLPSRALGFHSLRILPKHNLTLQFHCRKGYFYDEIR